MEARWMTTAEAAALLGVSRKVLDDLAERAVKVAPHAVVRVGSGTQRRTYRWHPEHLGEAVNAAMAARKEGALLTNPHQETT